MENASILITGCCGFIGSNLSTRLLKLGYSIMGIDNMNDYYDVRIKEKRLDKLKNFSNFLFIKEDICNYESISKELNKIKIDLVINLAAQAGVRYSLEHPFTYIQSNVVGFLNILEYCRHNNIKRLLYASSSSVYGNSDDVPFDENQRTDKPVSLYAATKKSDEMLAECYSKLYGIQCTGLRFFTVYGPDGRPDMAPMLFANAISEGREIKVFNNGNMLRDFTYIDDIVNGIVSIVESDKECIHEIYNIGCSNPVNLMDFIKEIEKNIGKKANIRFMEMQKGDVSKTFANTEKIQRDFGYKPSVMIDEGVKRFINWFKNENRSIND